MTKNSLYFKDFFRHSQKKSNVFLLVAALVVMAFINISISYAEIIPTYSINSIAIKNLLPKIGNTTLVLINIDDTIITPKSKMFSYNSSYKGLIDELNGVKKYNSSANQIIVNLIKQRQVILLEENWPDFIKQLQDKGALVFGFTRIDPIFRKVEDFNKWQYEQLNALGIKFTDKINDKDIFNFDDTNKNSPAFYHGIIFTDVLSNTVALESFVNIIGNSFDNVIVFSNKESELNEIARLFSTVEIGYYGIEYLAVTERTESPEVDVVKFQQDRLLTTGQWLEDDVAKELIKNTEPVNNK